MEGYRGVTLLPGTTTQMAARDIGINQQFSFPVDKSPLVNRRVVVSTAKCNSCHFSLGAHGGTRNQTTQCVVCHNPTKTDGNSPAQGINFATLVHKIHRGSALANGFIVSSTNFSDVGFPGDLRDCSTCHVNGSEQLPLVGDRLPTQDPKAYIPVMGATTAACLSCHDTKSAASHALANTTTLGESCNTCHGVQGDFSVSRVHAR
jgi:OmcA/MtrC family decaheme c-type cytochrome